jgi:cyanophycin synthetase
VRKGVEYVVFSYLEERAGRRAVEAAVEIVEASCKNENVDLKIIIDELHEIREEEFIGPALTALWLRQLRATFLISRSKTATSFNGLRVNQSALGHYTSYTSTGREVAAKNRTKACEDAGYGARGTTCTRRRACAMPSRMGFPL